MSYRSWSRSLVAVGAVVFLLGAEVDSAGGMQPDHDDIQRETFTDIRDGKTYRWVQIGSQTWMAENLGYATAAGSWCYEEDERQCDTYGRLYDWPTALSVCPDGWHLPSDEEWTTLEAALGREPGRQLKVGGTTGFEAMLAGVRLYSGDYIGIGASTHFWTSTSFSGEHTDHSFERGLFRDQPGMLRDGYGHVGGVSVRCIRDCTATPDQDGSKRQTTHVIAAEYAHRLF